MATGRSLPVILKKFDQGFDPGELKAAEISKKCRVLATLSADNTLKLWNIRNDANCTLERVTQFRWSLIRDCVDENHVVEDHLVAVKTDGNIELHSISKTSEDFTSSCDAVVGKEQLKGLLHDRGKDWLVGEVDLVSASRSIRPSKHEVSLLLDNKFVAVLSMVTNTAADILICFDVKNASTTNENTQLGMITEVTRCHKFFFTLLSNGTVLIHNMGDFVGSVNLWPRDNLATEDSVTVEERPMFTHLEVADDLSFVVCADATSNIYLVNLDEYFEDFPSQLIVPVYSRVRISSVGSVKFRYELNDEDSVARDLEMSGVAYGDRVWKTELLAFRRDAKQACLRNVSDVNSVCLPPVKKRWFSDLVSADDGSLFGAFSSCTKQPLTNTRQVSGFRAKQREEEAEITEELPFTGCVQSTLFIKCEAWMEMFTLEGVSVTPASFLLNFKPKKQKEDEDHSANMSHGVLCLFSCKTKEYLYHWLSEPSVIVQSCETVYPPLLLTTKFLAAPAFDISQDQLVHKVIMYENAGLADSLCFVNQWDHCTIPIHALEVALKLRQLDTVAFFLKNQDKAFTNRCAAFVSSSSSLSSPSSSLGESLIGTTDVEAVTEALVRAVNYNMQQQHYQHFTRQLAQMTLSYLHNLMEDGAKILESKDIQDSFHADESGQVAHTPFYQEIEHCLEFLTQSVVKLRCHLANMPSVDTERSDSSDVTGMPFTKIEMDEKDLSSERWTEMSDEEVVEDAIINRQICSAQTFFQSGKESVNQGDGLCDGSLSSFIEVGLKAILQKLLRHDMDTVVTMLTNMGRDVWQQLHKICLYTLHRPLRDFLAKELESRDYLSAEEINVVKFVHILESMYCQQSFTESKKDLSNSDQKCSWRDLGLLKSSFNLGSTQILDTYMQTGNLVDLEIDKQQNISNGSSYVELPLAWVCSWDDNSRQRILIERMLTCQAENGSAPPLGIEIRAEALWTYLSSHTNWQTLLGWIRSMALKIDASHDNPSPHVGEKFAVCGGDVVLPSLSRGIFSYVGSCHKVVKEIILEELTRNGMFTTSQLSNFSLLLHYLSTTQTLFGDNLPLYSLDGCSAGFSEDSLDREGCIVSIFQFHQSFIDYCIRLRLVNLLYHYLDFYRLCESVQGVKELRLDLNRPHWVDMLIKCRLLGRNCKDPDAVFQASLAMAGYMLSMESPSVTNILKAGHPVMALSSLLYGPTTVNQAIIPSESQPRISVWQVEDQLMHESLTNFPKVHSALFPTTSGSCGSDRQDVSVYRLLQGNSPFEISRLFGWQPTNDLAPKGDTSFDMPHFSNDLLVSQHAHVEKLTFSYYLRHGRPSFAFVSFIGDKLKDATVSKTKIQQAALKAYRVAVQHLSIPSVCAACVSFTEMLGLDSTALRVDIQAADRLLAHAGSEDLLGDDAKEGTTMQDAIASELLACAGKSNQKPERLFIALKNATRNVISKECLDKTSFEAGQHWNLVVLFCRVHKMEFPVTFLQDCARADKWLPFVCHAQACQFPKEQVVYVIEHDFSNAYIQEHLQLAFDNVQVIKVENPSSDELIKKRMRKRKLVRTGEQAVTPSRDVRAQFYSRMGLVAATTAQSSQSIKEEPAPHPSCSSSAEDEQHSKEGAKHVSDREPSSNKTEHETDNKPMITVDCPEVLLDAEEVQHNLFDILFKCQSVEVPWRHLLAHSITLHRSLLSVLAACFQDAKPLDCLCAWLCSTVSPSVVESAVATISELQWHQWTKEDLAALILAIVDKREKLAHTLAKAFYIFDPASPLVKFFHFHETFLVHCDYDACKEYLISFKISYSKLAMKVATDKHMDVLKIGTLEWLEELTSQVTKQMLTHCESAHQQHHLLAILARTMFGRNFLCKVPDYHELNEVSTVLHGTDTEMRLEVMLEKGSEDSQAEKERVLLSLLNTKHFMEARKFAELVKLSGDHITRKEVEAELENAKNSMLWEIEQGRLAFWHKAEKCFRDHGCKPDTVGSFFENQASDTELSFTERAMLLGKAVKWFSNLPSDQQEKTQKDLQELHKKRWLFKIRAEIEKDLVGNLTRSVSHLEFLSHETEMELLSEIKPANREVVSRKAVNLKELVQDDTADVQTDSECPLETEKEIRALEKVIGDLLEGCHVNQAQWLARLFNHSCLELDVVMSCIHLAQGTRFVDTLDDHIQILLSYKGRQESLDGSSRQFHRSGSFIFTSSFTEKMAEERHDSVSSADWVKVEDIITSMESLAFHCKQGKRCCNCIITCYRVAQTLGQEYETIVNKKPLGVLHSLLLSGFDNRYKLMESYIKAIQLDSVEVTQFLADIILNSLRVHSTGEDISGREYSDLTVNAAPSCEDISQMIRLCPDYSLLGGRLLDTATSLANERAEGTTLPGGLNLEVELLVRAHECHTLACNMEGIAAVLRNGRVLTTALAETREYMLMVRLLTGIARFHEMSYIFDTLFEHEHFELLCRRGIDKENKLKVALLEYLRRQHPEDTDKFSMVAHHFSMYREIAQTLEETAVKQLASLGDCFPEKKQVQQANTEKGAADVFFKLNSIMKSFCYASDNYAKENCWRHSQNCLRNARLVHLQIQVLSSGVTVVNLDEHALKKFLAHHTHFFQSLLVAEAYKKRDTSIWVDAVYHQVVMKGNFNYFQDMRSALPLSNTLFADLANKYKNENSRSSQAAANMKRLLAFVSDVRMRYKLATDLNFRDLGTSILEGDGGAFLRDVMVP